MLPWLQNTPSKLIPNTKVRVHPPRLQPYVILCAAAPVYLPVLPLANIRFLLLLLLLPIPIIRLPCVKKKKMLVATRLGDLTHPN